MRQGCVPGSKVVGRCRVPRAEVVGRCSVLGAKLVELGWVSGAFLLYWIGLAYSVTCDAEKYFIVVWP